MKLSVSNRDVVVENDGTIKVFFKDGSYESFLLLQKKNGEGLVIGKPGNGSKYIDLSMHLIETLSEIFVLFSELKDLGMAVRAYNSNLAAFNAQKKGG